MKTVQSFWPRTRRFFLYCIFFFFSSTIFVTLCYRFIRPPVTYLMLKRCAEQVADGQKIRLKKKWIDIDKVSVHMIKALIASEDNHFYTHSGFDFKAIKKAREHNKHSKRKHGASTISQQTAKNVFLWPARTYLRKGLETYFTVLIEIFWPKKRILEIYMNIIETGNGIYGVEPAAQYYYNKSSAELNRHEAAMIAAILPNPRKYNPKHPSAYLLARQKKILWLMSTLKNTAPFRTKK